MSIQVSIGELFTLAKGRRAPEVFETSAPGLERYIQIEDLRSNANLKYARDSNGTLVFPTDICIAWDGANAGTVGYGLDGLIGSTIARLRPIAGDRLFSPYVARYLQHHFATLNGSTNGATIPHINRDQLMGMSPHLPGFDEQCRISKALDKADKIRKYSDARFSDSNEFVRSAALQLIRRLPETRIPLEDLLPSSANSMRTGPFGSQLLHSEFTASGIPVLGIDNVVTNRFRWAERRYISEEKYASLRRYRVFPGDVMITIMGTTGRVCIAPDDLRECISTKHLCTITPDRSRLLQEYLWASLLWDPEIRAQAAREGKGAIMEGWNMGIVRGLLIKPAPMEDQRRFAALVRKVETLRVSLHAESEEADTLFKSLVQRAFSGKPVGHAHGE